MRIILPLTVAIPRKTKEDKVFILNLNIFRNTHHMTLNQAKVQYELAVATALENRDGDMPPPPYKFTYTVFPSSKRAFDLGNVLSIIQKFTDDSLIKLGVISEDNYKVVAGVEYKFGEVDKDHPRAELLIKQFIPEVCP